MMVLRLRTFLVFCVFICVSYGEECLEFECKTTGKCLDYKKVCDGKKDCSDNSDEDNCDLRTCNPPEWFQCADNKTCISADFFCNGEENCPGGDDEDHCSGPHVHAQCNDMEFTCSDKTCIPLRMVCDGKQDCLDDSDETVGCVGIEDRCAGFLCRNKRCLESHTWICDGYDDCGDGSDEVGCPSNCKIEDHKFLCKDNHSCIAIEKACDGVPDCHDKSDEGDKCHSLLVNCTSLHCPIPSECYNLPTGGACVCPKGYYFDTTKERCLDIDECQNYGICSQGCTNTQGSYVCTCANKFKLGEDGRSCVVRGAEPLLLYTTQKSVVGVYLKSRHIYNVATNLSHVIGVDYDGLNVYWTTIKHQAESIVKSREDGSHQETLLTSGLDAPEDLAVDWLTGNIYFTDNMMKHIAVCSNDGFYCTILVMKDVDQPRGIALNPLNGTMYWSDWGIKPMIAKASMDGEDVRAIVNTDIHWPNGITLDLPNNRLYWVDAKMETIESIRLDGTDRKVVLTEILKHPYGIAVFEDRLYWTDWGTNSLHSCHKFTGKHHDVVIKDTKMYDVHIYHSAIQPKQHHPCIDHACSHLCLLAANNSYTCACPESMILGVDHLTCKKVVKKQRLFLGIGNYLVHMEHTSFGRHKIADGVTLPMFIHKLAFNSINGTIFIADNVQRIIYEVDVNTKSVKELVKKNLGNVTAMSFDHLTSNLYWSDRERHTIEVLSLRNMERAIVHHFSGNDVPIAMAIIPEEGRMFVALRSTYYTHIDVQKMHGRGSHHHVVENEIGNGNIQILIDPDTETVFWVDTEGGKIEFSNFEGSIRHLFRSRLKKPSAIAAIDDDLVWSTYGSRTMYYTHRSNLGSIKKFELEMPPYFSYPDQIAMVAARPLYVVDHNCQHNNGGCSHVCVSLGKFSSACLCPPGAVFKDSKNMTCIDSLDCEFRCRSGECLTASRRCNGRKDCADGSDEELCDDKDVAKAKIMCKYDEFTCSDKTQCIPVEARCNMVNDCNDKSDEEHCDESGKRCHAHQHQCDNGRCVDLSVICDSFDDCGDGSDEKMCDNFNETLSANCGENMFRCTKGPCIPKKWECDGHLDCDDGSDEHDKCASADCPAGLIKCKLGQCIDEKLLCDGNDDCGDESDELNCEDKIRKIVCGDEIDSFGDPTKFQCPSDPLLCLDMQAKCNGTAECPRGEDEVGCSGCSVYEFECRDTKDCIRREFRCDNQKDCSDGSDEMNCENRNETIHYHFNTMCSDNMFDCKDKTCIDKLRVCDGNIDCEQGEDEGPGCKTACINHSCDQTCTPSPYGAVCSCHDGYQLNGDKKGCSDINECIESTPCAQICENEYGSFRCSCYSGFMLRSDKTSCKSIDGDHYMIFSSYNQIRKLSENPLALQILWSTNDSRMTGLSVNVKEKLAYFTVAEEEAIYEYNLENKSIRSIYDSGTKSKISIDWITNNVYVLDYSGRYTIKVCNFIKSMCAQLIKFAPRDVVKALYVDAYNKYIFYSVVHSSIFGSPRSIIYKSGLDGSRPEILLKLEGFITAIDCDIYKNELYFTDLHSKTLQMLSYKGGQATAIIKKEHAIKNPSGLSIYENIAFIINTGSPEAVKCHLYGDKSCQAFNLNVYNAADIVVVASTRQKYLANPCEANSCSAMCVQADTIPKCLCPNGEFVQPKAQCPNGDGRVQSISASTSNGDSDSSSPGGALIVCFVTMGIILMGLLGYMYYRRKTGRGNFNINMHFQNPLARPDESQTIAGHAHSKIYRPFQRFFRKGRNSEISLDSGAGDLSFTAARIQEQHGWTGISNAISEHANDSDNDESRDVGHFDDRSRLVL